MIKKLRKKALDSGLKTHNSAELLLYYLDYEGFRSALEGLINHKRLDVEAAKVYLEAKKQWKKE